MNSYGTSSQKMSDDFITSKTSSGGQINIDESHHTFTTKVCPICGASPTDTYQRCVGYLVPSHSWSEGRRRELAERDWMNLNDIIL